MAMFPKAGPELVIFVYSLASELLLKRLLAKKTENQMASMFNSKSRLSKELL